MRGGGSGRGGVVCPGNWVAGDDERAVARAANDTILRLAIEAFIPAQTRWASEIMSSLPMDDP